MGKLTAFLCSLLLGLIPDVGVTNRQPMLSDDIRFNEVLADVPGREGNGGGEWIELRNDGNRPVDLCGWSVGDESDQQDHLIAWQDGGSTTLLPGQMALILDPDSNPATLQLPAALVIMHPDDSSIGNGLRGDGESIHLLDPSGITADTLVWVSNAGEGISWERALRSQSGRETWQKCRASSGSTPGRINSWVPVAGDRSIEWRNIPPYSLPAEGTYRVTALLRDEGGEGLPSIRIGSTAGVKNRERRNLGDRLIGSVAPGDSVEVDWEWTPESGGEWVLAVRIVSPQSERGWSDTDSLIVAVSFPELSRVLSEAQPRPLEGGMEWLEFWRIPDRGDRIEERVVEWGGWYVSVRSLRDPYARGRTLVLPPVEGEVLLIASGDSVRTPGGNPLPGGESTRVVWPGLRLTDTGSLVTLIDPFESVVDSSVIRPVPDLPQGHSWQRWNPSIPGWSPDAWGLSRSIDDVTPGWVGEGLGGVQTGADGECHIRVDHSTDGAVVLSWSGPAARVWIEAQVYDMSGRHKAMLMPRVLASGTGHERWYPSEGPAPLRPGIYVLIVRVEAEGAPGRWTFRRALGVRP